MTSRTLLLLSLLLGAVACSVVEDDDATTGDDDDSVATNDDDSAHVNRTDPDAPVLVRDLGDLPDLGGGWLLPCGAPVDGFDRLTEIGASRGLTALPPPGEPSLLGCPVTPSSIVAHDLDRDLDIDLLFTDPRGFPTIYRNDGLGNFEAIEVAPSVASMAVYEDRAILAASAIDLDGDHLPELALAGEGLILVFPNLGRLQWGAPTVILETPDYPRECIHSLIWGDVDGDGDLDLVAPGLDAALDGSTAPDGARVDTGTWDRVYLNEGDTFVEVSALAVHGEPWVSFGGVLTDRDNDGDLDLLLGTDRADGGPHRMGFYRNDGLDGSGHPIWVEDGAEVGATDTVCLMGADSADLNGDGFLDYCMSNWAQPNLHCLLSSPFGYVEGGLAIGLVTDSPNAHPWTENDEPRLGWVPWGVSLVDLDADGALDAASVAGVPFPDLLGANRPQFLNDSPNTLWQGQEDGTFLVRSSELGFDSRQDHYGLVAADLTRDGYPDLVISPAEGPPLIWDNPCGSNNPLVLDLRGPPGNSEGYGARITVQSGDQTILREMLNLRALSQGPSELYFGLGQAQQVDQLEVRWPDGVLTILEDLEVRQRITAVHPQAAAP